MSDFTDELKEMFAGGVDYDIIERMSADEMDEIIRLFEQAGY